MKLTYGTLVIEPLSCAYYVGRDSPDIFWINKFIFKNKELNWFLLNGYLHLKNYVSYVIDVLS